MARRRSAEMAEVEGEEPDVEETRGMASGSDAGAPGERVEPEPLGADEQAILADLRARRPHVVDRAVEEAPRAAAAADDDAPLPADLRSEETDDPLTPQ